jgi:hypothetical protein
MGRWRWMAQAVAELGRRTLVDVDENLFVVARPFEAPLCPNGPSTDTFEAGARLIRTGETPDGTQNSVSKRRRARRTNTTGIFRAR